MKKKEKSPGFPLSERYLVVDQKKCAGCISCMLACSLVHHGASNPSLARIQIVQSAFQPFPDDIEINLCRQCANPHCVKACPTGAINIDSGNKNVRAVNESLCDGCGDCIKACPFTPSRMIWNHLANTAVKCDLCADAKHWDKKGGPGGKQACIEICPMRALKLVEKTPSQRGDKGYLVNLRNEHWAWIGYPTD
jgi:Fe-S-cluster-containing dehydrogenase component